MVKVKVEKQNDTEVEFVKEVEFQVMPKKGDNIEIENNQYVVKSIKQSPEFIIITVKDKSYKNRKNLGLL